jgi:hypothetical protein
VIAHEATSQLDEQQELVGIANIERDQVKEELELA